MSIERLEAGSGGPFTVKLDGMAATLRDPVDMDFQEILACLDSSLAPDLPHCAVWKRELASAEWAAHHDLPAFADAQRLCYVVDRYDRPLTYDLAHFVDRDLGQLWRARRWRTLLSLIDHLPSHSWYAATVADDDEHVRMLAESMANQPSTEGPPKGPPLHTWDPTVAVLTQVLDAVRQVSYTVQAVQGGKAPAPDLAPRPHSKLESAIKRAEFDLRKARHDSLAARLLPHKRRE